MNEKLKVLDLFSGIGGFSLGLERTGGFETVAFCEIDPYCRKVLRKHWPGVPIFEDVRELTGEQVGTVDVICGGFPCQDISQAGSGAGIDGERSGLWSEYSRLIGVFRPAFILVENVSMLLGRGLDRVLGDLATLGYDAEWHCIQAAAVGAPHLRDRIWIIAYPQHSDANGERPHRAQGDVWATQSLDEQGRLSGPLGAVLADACGQSPRGPLMGVDRGRRRGDVAPSGEDVADPGSTGLATPEQEALQRAGRREEGRATAECGWWSIEPDVGRVAHGVPNRVDRLRALGNAVVPQIVEVLGNAILQAENAATLLENVGGDGI